MSVTEARGQTSGDQWARGGGEGEDGEGERETQTPTNRTDKRQVCAVQRRGQSQRFMITLDAVVI